MFDATKPEHVKKYISMLKLNGDFYGKHFNLLDWQKEFIDQIYGNVNEEGYRIYNYAYLELPKKQGKTELIAAIASYHLNCKKNDEIYCCAADREQASLIFKAIQGEIDQDAYLSKMARANELRVYTSKKVIQNNRTKSKLTVLSAEAYTKHGLNPTVVIFDELHAQPNRELWDTMTFGSGSTRKEPLYFVITTAGDDPDRKSIGWEIHQKARDILAGNIIEPNWFCKIYGFEADDEIDIYDEKNWYKANPSLGTTVSIETVRKEAIAAQNNPSTEKLFRWLRLNMWVSTKSYGWKSRSEFEKKINKSLTIEQMSGKICYIGLDLSSVNDLTSEAIIFPKQPGVDKITVYFHNFVPADNVKQRTHTDKVPYEIWIKEGYITATDGNVVDYNFLKWRLRNDSLKYKVKEFGIDPWQAEKLRQDLELMSDMTVQEARGYKSITLTDVPQTIAMFCPVMKEIDRLMGQDEIQFINNPVAAWACGNIMLVTDGNENYKPDKKKSKERIDPMVAMFNAFHLYMKNGTTQSVYETRGVRTI